MKQTFKTLAVIILLTVVIAPSKTLAQAPDTSTMQKLLQYIFQPVNKTQVPTGILEEYGCPMLPMATFNGILTDSNRIDINLWRTLYFQLQTGYCQTGTNPFPVITSVNTTIKQNAGNVVPIPLLIAQYNTVKSNAFSSNLLAYNSSTKQVSDVAGRTQSPYQTNNLFAASPTISQSITGRDSFICKTNLAWNNSGKTISLLQIDFANGEGFKTISIGTAIAVNYADTGSKRWVIKATLSDNSILQCYSDYYVVKVTPAVAARYLGPSTFSNGFDAIQDFPANGTDGGGRIYIAYTGRNGKVASIRKPLIVVEGYDVNKRAPGVQTYNYTYRHLIDAIDEPRNFYDFNKDLDETAGYDLIFIDFNDGADDIIRNAALVQRVITYINGIKINNSNNGNIREQNVVMGLSMGGLCARYALANMTKSSLPTETRLLITHDSPHKGANVPLGLQYLIRMMGGFQLFGTNVYDIYPQYDDAIKLLNAPATQQLLLYQSTGTNTFVNNTFIDGAYKTMVTFPATGPQPAYRFIATALGNECANPLFAPYKTFINTGAGVSAGITLNFFLFPIPLVSYKLAAEVEAYALPTAGATSKIARLYTINNLKLLGFINIFKQLYNNTAYAPGNHLAVDGVPGSISPLLDIAAFNTITNLPVFNRINLSIQFNLGWIFGGYFKAYAFNSGFSPSFTFVSAASALDASPYTTPVFSQKYVGGINPTYPSTSETFIAQETNNSAGTTNNVHIRFTARNSQWLYNQMEGIATTLNCSSECAATGLSISGNGTLCNAGTYCVSNIPTGTQITWTANPSIVSLAPVGNGSCVNISKLYNGNLTLTARTACSTSVTKAIRVGIYSTSDYNITQFPSPVCANGTFQVGMPWYYTLPAPNTTYNWYYGNGVSYVSGQGTNVITLKLNPPYSSPYVMGRANNDCGQGPFQTITVSVDPNCTSSFTVSPNPSSDVINVEPNNDPAARAALTTPAEVRQVELTDKMGIVRYKHKFGKGTTRATINVSNLPSDIYTLNIFNGRIWFAHKVIVQH